MVKKLECMSEHDPNSTTQTSELETVTSTSPMSQSKIEQVESQMYADLFFL